MDWIETDRAPLPVSDAAAMQQYPIYGKVCAHRGAGTRYFRLKMGRHVMGSALVLIRRWPGFGRFALISRGPVYRTELAHSLRIGATERLVRILRQDMRGVMITPDCDGGPDPLGSSDLLTMVSPGSLARLDLRASSAERRARAHGKWRNRLVRAEQARLGLRHSPLPADHRHWLLSAEAEQSRARGYQRLPLDFTQNWAMLGGRRATRLFVAEHRPGDPIAAMLFLLHGQSASYHIGWSNPQGRAVNAHNLLLWQASEWLAAKGYSSLDLGSLDTERSPGLARFKLGSGAVPIRLGATRLDAPGTGFFARQLRPRQKPKLYASSSASQYR
ncbi:MAG: GNAT family N-acetyltransferase [Mangrovicoccus sp.]|nr:GNAT family N-acetyltransferase [Mangrovicoccus sp.]